MGSSQSGWVTWRYRPRLAIPPIARSTAAGSSEAGWDDPRRPARSFAESERQRPGASRRRAQCSADATVEQAARGARCLTTSMRAAAVHLRRPSPALAALVVVLLASVALRFVAALGLDAPWIAPDEFAYGLLGRAFWTTGHMQLLDGSSQSYGLYPVVAGLPLALFGAATGLAVLKGVEAILITSTAAIAFVWARPVAGAGWAVAAAALTVALPGFAYSGLIMKESVAIPTATLALWLLARALARPSLANQALLGGGVALAVAVRFQAAILLPTILVAALLHAWFCRDRTVLRRFVPTLATLGIVAALGIGVVLLGSRWTVLGQSHFLASSDYALVPALRWI